MLDIGILAAAEAAPVDMATIVPMIFQVIGGLGIFMLGMKYMSDGLQTIAGHRLRSMISAVTNNRLLATSVGCGVTMLVQSSSVTTVMVVGFVNAGFMTLAQAIGVIMGANIGTTITGWILVLKIGKYGLVILGAAALIYRFAKSDRWRYLAMVAMGIGMIFFGLQLMKAGFKPIRTMPDFEAWFSTFQAHNYFGVLKCAMVGCMLTMIVQSSSATLGITMGLASTGVIPFETAAALVLGENIGTTITAWLASRGTTTNAKRAAYAHMTFNIIGVIWITALFGPYIHLVKYGMGLMGQNPALVTTAAGGEMSYPYIIAGIAIVHTAFNVANTLMFLPFTQILARVLIRLVPEKAYKEAPHLTGLDMRLLETPPIGIEQSRVEIIRMGSVLTKAMARLRESISTDKVDDKVVRKIFHAEEILDIIQREIVEFLTNLLSGAVSHEMAEEGRQQLRIADEYESISDYIAAILKLHLRLVKANHGFSPEQRESMLKLHDETTGYMELVIQGYEQGNPDTLSKASSRAGEITHLARELRDDYLAKVTEKRSEPLVTVVYTDMLHSYRRVKDHLLNVAESLAGEK